MAKQNKPKVGAGLRNLGNTCFANSVLQCLTHTAPLMDYMLTRQHSKNCRSAEFCMMCVMESHMNKAFKQSGRVMTPCAVTDHLNDIADHFVLGQQEDAHEFLQYAINGMQNSCIYDDASTLSSVQTDNVTDNLVDRIFKGSLKSQVVCQNCHYTSDRYEEILDIPLEINSSNNITQSLKDFVRAETLEGDNAYRCSQCNQLVRAKKRCTIDKAPNILTLSLKRFNIFTGQKLTKTVSYPAEINISPYTSSGSGAIKYNLYGVLVHNGSTSQSGHYYAYVKASHRWYLMNDSQVTPCDAKTALNQGAYVLFYNRVPSEPCRTQPELVTACCKNTSVSEERTSKPHSTPTAQSESRKRKARQPRSLKPLARRREVDSDSMSAVHQQEMKAESAKPVIVRMIARKRQLEGGDGQPGLKRQAR